MSLLVLSNGVQPTAEIRALASERGTAIVVSPLDSYVTSRMVTLSKDLLRTGREPADRSSKEPRRVAGWRWLERLS